MSVGEGRAESEIAGWDELVAVYYRLEVTNYCGLASAQVLAGFKVINSRLLDKYAFSKEQLNAIRGEAWAAGYKEWDNRGLGGFRRWCKNEGQRYAAEFIELVG